MNVRSLIHTAKHHWLTVAFIGGFVTDNILLNRIDSLIDQLTLLLYVVLGTTGLVLFYAGVAEKLPSVTARFLQKYTPVVMQYAFGGLLSGMLIFYGRAGDWVASAPFLLLILVVILGNEFIDKRSDRLVYNIALYFIGMFSYVVLVIPVITGKMGDVVFFLSGVLALGIVTLVVQALFKIVPQFMMMNTRRLIFTLGIIYVTFNVLYLTNIIPPIPLSLTELEVVQSVDRMQSGDYRVVYEDQPWYRSLPFMRTVIHPQRGEVACFARVYAPTNLHTDIYHRWERKNADGQWEEYFTLNYPISGENKGGYRGYTRILNFQSGEWRCSVETKRGQVLGRKTFMIDTAGAARELVTRIE
ncbi:DUF2914 domain-containing protein [Candidatus Kaiserbacteria bacterium]|nr:DUF2914 domain-containing protein [Candidatus Kaiserbacteria bacterium]